MWKMDNSPELAWPGTWKRVNPSKNFYWNFAPCSVWQGLQTKLWENKWIDCGKYQLKHVISETRCASSCFNVDTKAQVLTWTFEEVLFNFCALFRAKRFEEKIVRKQMNWMWKISTETCNQWNKVRKLLLQRRRQGAGFDLNIWRSFIQFLRLVPCEEACRENWEKSNELNVGNIKHRIQWAKKVTKALTSMERPRRRHSQQWNSGISGKTNRAWAQIQIIRDVRVEIFSYLCMWP